MARFIECLSLCHTVQIDTMYKSRELGGGNGNSSPFGERYNASSPDELSFVKFCTKIGVHFEGDYIDKSSNKLIRRIMYSTSHHSHYNKTLHNKNDLMNSSLIVKEYEILNVLEFDSTRKRMSILIYDSDLDRYMVFCKGADSAIFAKSICQTSQIYDRCLKEFSEKGWRTMVLAFKIITKSEYEYYSKLIDEANNDILNKEKKLSDAYEEIENNFSIVGITSVEDKLQESVENTLMSLREAGIKIWVLTGDKIETAINISESCKHFSTEMHKLMLKGIKNAADIRSGLQSIKSEYKHKVHAMHNFRNLRFDFHIQRAK